MLFLSPVNYSQSRAKQQHRTGALPIENWAWTLESIQMHVEMRRSEPVQRSPPFNNIMSALSVCATCHSCSKKFNDVGEKNQLPLIQRTLTSRRSIDLTRRLPAAWTLHSAGIFTIIMMTFYLFIYLCISSHDCTVAAHTQVTADQKATVLTQTLVGWVPCGPGPRPVLVEGLTPLAVLTCRVVLAVTCQSPVLAFRALAGVAVALAPDRWENKYESSL